MKLSEIRGEDTLDVVARLIEPTANILSDENLAGLTKSEERPDGMSAEDFARQRLVKAIPKIIRSHKRDVTEILAAVNRKTFEEYEQGMTLASLIVDLTEIMTDEEFADFFISFGKDGMTPTDGSGLTLAQ